MPIANIIIALLGIVSIAMGIGMVRSEKCRRWVLSYGKGKMWVKLLGESRAHKATRFIFGPIAALFGVGMVLAALLGGPIDQ